MKRWIGELMFLIGISAIFWLWNLETDGISHWYGWLIIAMLFGLAWTSFSFGFDLILEERLKEREKDIKEHGKPITIV